MSTSCIEKRQNKRGQLMLVGLAAYVLVPTLVAPTLAQGQVITLSRDELEQEIETALECYIHPEGPGCYPDCDRNNPNDPDCPSEAKPSCPLRWDPGLASVLTSSNRVRVSRKNTNTINADAHFKCLINNLPNPDVDIRMALTFSCFWREPSVRVSPSRVDIEIGWPWYIDVATASVSWWIGNIRSRAETSKFRAGGAAQDFTEEQMVPLDYCPGISVQSNGDVQIDLAMGTECTDGQTRHRSCSGNHYGPGVDFTCVGGRWGHSGGWCEPEAPPGGQRP
jgi:hypothetical protein